MDAAVQHDRTISSAADFSDVWAILPSSMPSITTLQSQAMVPLPVYDATPEAVDPKALNILGNASVPTSGSRIAIIELRGMMRKDGRWWREESSSVFVRQQIEEAGRRDDVDGIMLVIESPGGHARGTLELATAVAEAASAKPTHVFCEDLCASAAYWVASQANHISANAPAAIGSIGTLVVLHDYSKMYDEMGVKVLTVKRGEWKDAGIPGKPIQPEHLVDVQAYVDSLQAMFSNAIASGRGLSDDVVESLADGRLHPAESAKALQLIDEVETFESAMQRLHSAIVDESTNNPQSISQTSNPSSLMSSTTTETPATPQTETPQQTATPETTLQPPSNAATIGEIKAVCKGANNDFIVACMSANMTVDQCRDKWIETLQSKCETQATQIQELQKHGTTEPSKPTGVAPMNQSGGGDAGEPDNFAAAVQERKRQEACSTGAAIAWVRDNRPELIGT
ncbi:MAG: S49 family peptidase [Planctomycetota bacterium]